ncbi:MAG: Fe-S cluster assembly protein SufD [Rhodospirillales bacterium]|nr:Fe-S cluster assembly protein SufD [Rhodospirillales bacterium]
MARQAISADQLLQGFDAGKGALPGRGLPWLANLRAQGRERFRTLGLPTAKLEAWRYTRLRPFEDTQFRPATEADGRINVDVIPALLKGAAARIVFINGLYRQELSNVAGLPAGVSIEPLAKALAAGSGWIADHLGRVAGETPQAFFALNTALMDSGVVVKIARGTSLDLPIEIVHVSGLTDRPIMYSPRNLILVEEGASATVLVHHVGLGAGAYFVNGATEVDVRDGGSLRHYTVEAESIDAINLATAHVRVGRDAHYEAFGLAVGGRLSRSEVSIRLAAPGASCKLNGAYLMRGAEHCDNTTVIEHLAPHTSSREVFKGVLDDESRAVFQGRIVVHKGAQKSDGHQLSKALLLSAGAEIDQKPELEIYTDDVKCSHGAAAGQLDAAQLFYLRSRGIPEALARNLLVQAFLAEAVEEVSDIGVREAMMDKVVHWLPAQCYLQEQWRGR